MAGCYTTEESGTNLSCEQETVVKVVSLCDVSPVYDVS